MLLLAHWIAVGSLICLSITRGQSGNDKNEIVKKHIGGERFLYTSSRGKDAVSDVVWGIKLRGVFLTRIMLPEGSSRVQCKMDIQVAHFLYRSRGIIVIKNQYRIYWKNEVN